MGGAVFLPRCLSGAKLWWRQWRCWSPPVKAHASPAARSAPSCAAGHHRPTPLLETPGHSQTGPGQSLVRSLLLSPGSWCLPRAYFPVLCKVWQLHPPKRAYAIPTSTAPRSPGPVAVHCGPIPPQMLKHSSVSVSVWSLGPGAHKVCLSPLSVSGGNGV